MNKIFGIGLPRTGTASLAEALNNMRHPTSHHCILHDGTCETHIENDIVAHVDNGFYLNYETLLEQHPNALFILTTRNLDDWTKSISKLQSTLDHMPNVESYEKAVVESFKRAAKENQLLVLNIFEDSRSIYKLSEFVGVKSDHITFPHVLRH